MIAWTLVALLWLLGGALAVGGAMEDYYVRWYSRLLIIAVWPPLAAAGLVIGFWKAVRRCVSS